MDANTSRRRAALAIALVLACAGLTAFHVEHGSRRAPRAQPDASSKATYKPDVNLRKIYSNAGPAPGADAPLAAVVDQLIPAARFSSRAACQLAVELVRCRVADMTLETVADMEHLLPAETRGERAGRMAQLHQQTAACSQLPSEQLDAAFLAQARAFEGGSPAVQRWAIEHPAPGEDGMSDAARERMDRDLVHRYAREAWRRRDASDLAMLMRIHAPLHEEYDQTYAGDLPDEARMLALVDVADRLGVEVPADVEVVALRTTRTAAIDAQVARHVRYLLARPWKRLPTPPPPVEDAEAFADMNTLPPAECTTGEIV